MTTGRMRSLARWAGRVAVAVTVASVAVLVGDYALARARAPKDASTIAALQVEAQITAAVAERLAAEHDRVTRERRARKARGHSLAIILIASSSALVANIKWLTALDGRRGATLPPRAIPLALVAPSAHAAADPPPASKAAQTLDLSFVDAIIEGEGRSAEAAIPILQAIQAHYRYLPDEALRRVCERTEVTPSRIAGTSSFYARFRRSPVGDHVIRVCHGTACHVSGARQITEELRRYLDIPDNSDTDPARMFTLDEVACLGCCSLAPVLMVDEHTSGRLTPASACAALDVVRQTERT